jgi:hypothetical protein
MKNMNENQLFAQNKKKAVEFTEKENPEFHGRLASIIRSISGLYNLEVTTEVDARTLMKMAREGQDAHEQWYRHTEMDPVTRKVIKQLVHIPRQIMESKEEVALGKAAHEAGHVAITRFGEFIPVEVMKELGFSSLINASEERPTDNVIKTRYEGAREWVIEARKDGLIEEDPIAEADRIKTQEARRKIPKFIQLNNLIVYSPYYDAIPDYYSPEVIEIYNEVADDLELMENSLPREGAPEAEIKRSAIKRYNIIYKKIWPRLKELVQEDIKNERLKQTKNRATEINLDGISPELLALLMQLQELLKQLEALSMLKPDEPNEDLEDDEADTPEELPEVKVELENEIDKKVEEIYDNLPEDLRQQINEEAEQELENQEDALVEKIGGKLMENPPENHKELKEREDRERSEKNKQQQKETSEKELREIDERLKALEKNKSEYEKTYQGVRAAEQALYRELEDVFNPNLKKKMQLRSSGAKINLPAVYRWEASRQAGASNMDNKIFESIQTPDKKDYAFSILVDLSGSMQHGGRATEAYKGVILLSEVLSRLGIKFELVGFSNGRLNIFKKFEDILTDNLRRSIVFRPNGLTPTDLALKYSFGKMKDVKAKDRFIITITDGDPDNYSKTENVVKEIMKNSDIKLVGLGLGEGTDMVKRLFPAAIPNISAEELPRYLSQLLKDFIDNPQKYSH